jgi:hypothetical protein
MKAYDHFLELMRGGGAAESIMKELGLAPREFSCARNRAIRMGKLDQSCPKIFTGKDEKKARGAAWSAKREANKKMYLGVIDLLNAGKTRTEIMAALGITQRQYDAGRQYGRTHDLVTAPRRVSCTKESVFKQSGEWPLMPADAFEDDWRAAMPDRRRVRAA